MTEPVETAESSHHALEASFARRRFAFRLTSALALAAAIGSSWYLFLRRPSPEAVCAHLDDLLDEPEGGVLVMWLDVLAIHGEEPPAVATWREHCVWFYSTRRKHDGWWEYGERARCAIGMSEPDGIIRCER